MISQSPAYNRKDSGASISFNPFIAAARVSASAAPAYAQTPMSYGPSITVEPARKVAAAAVAEARKNKFTMAIAVVDTAGDLVYFERMDDTQVGSVDVAIGKARSAARFKRPTKVFQEQLAAGGAGVRMLALQGAVPVAGGVPIVSGGKIVGAIGCSGGTSDEDAQCAQAGANVMK
jgi:uncharacterized protein GlcG (DUF336 family)